MIVVISLGMLLRLFPVQEALSGFSNVTVWLIVAAFLFARGLTHTRLGERIAYTIVERVGGSPLRLGYAIVLADLVMAPMTPSNTARAGGILFPVTLNVARVFDSQPGPTADRDRRVPDEDALPGGPRGVGDVSHRDRSEPPGRGVRATGLDRATVLDDLGARGVGARHRRARRRAVCRLPAVPAHHHRHVTGAVAGRGTPARAWDRSHAASAWCSAIFS